MNCETDAAFLGKILILIRNDLRKDVITNLENIAIKLSEKKKQRSTSNQSQQTTKIKIKTYLFSNLSSDMIDHFGSFLTSKQRCYFSCLNRQLFIETQKESFIFNQVLNNI